MRILAKNKKALFDYEVIKSYEAGLVLQGWEVKSAKAGNVSLKESYVTLKNSEAWLVNANFSPWPGMGKKEAGIELRPRKLLLNSTELKKLIQTKSIKGYAVIPTEMLEARGKIKLQIALAKGRTQYDKRQKLKEKDMKSQIKRDLAA